MNRDYKELLLGTFEDEITSRFPYLKEYVVPKKERVYFLSGSRLFEHRLEDDGASVFVAVSPGEGSSAAYSVLLGWSFEKGSIPPFNVLEQIRVLENRPHPSARFASGFFELGHVEGRIGSGEESIRAPWNALDDPVLLKLSTAQQKEVAARAAREEAALTTDERAKAVRESVQDVMSRLAVQLPAFTTKVAEALRERS